MVDSISNEANKEKNGQKHILLQLMDKLIILAKMNISVAKHWIDENKKLSIVLICVILVINVPLFLILNHKSGMEIKANKILSQQKITATHIKANPFASELNDITEKLSKLEEKLSGKQSYLSIDQLRAELSQSISQLNKVSEKSSDLISNEINRSTNKLQTQLQAIKKELAKLQYKKQQHKLISASNLPFKVISIDNIEQADVVSVRYDHHILPLEVGDTLAGWRLNNASLNKQGAEFNRKNQYVRVNLNQIKESRG